MKMPMLKKALIALYAGVILVLAITTFVEQAQGTAFVEKHIYHTVWFCCLWGAVAVGTLLVLIRRASWLRLPVLLLHGSFLVILAGAMITFVWGVKGHMHLRPGMTENGFCRMDGTDSVRLPFTLRLDSFRVEYYAGTEAASDYVSYVTCSFAEQMPVQQQERISMNHILRVKGYRFYQSSYDNDGEGSWLTVNYDPWGTGVTYAGYALLGLSMLLLLGSRQGEFRRLLRHPLLRKGGLFLLLACCLVQTGQAQRKALPVLNRTQADSLARTQVIYHDRVAPFNTLARDFLQKLSGKDSYHGLTAEQVLGGWLLRPDVWQHEPILKIKNGELRRLLRLDAPYARLSDLFDGTTYRLQTYWQQEDKQSKLAKAIRETDEKVGLILMLKQGTLIRPLPADGSVKPLPAVKVEAELLYNRIPFSKWLFMFNLTMGLMAFACLLVNSLRKHPLPSVWRRTDRFFTVALYAAFLFHLAGYALRWYIGGRIPLSNGYETMQFMALCILLLSCLLRRKFPFTLPFGFLLSGFTLLVSYLGQMNPQITPLMPVLVFPLLSAHVSLIMMSYALLAFTLLNGVLALCLCRKHDNRVEQLTLLSRLLLYPAVFFLGIGIFLGAVWANVSWGRYWAWDPKEVWALITFMVYGVAFHTHSLSWLRKPVLFHAYLIVAFLTVLMTYFGVNYLLGGMHSYANA